MTLGVQGPQILDARLDSGAFLDISGGGGSA
jgi:hypothetical protein